MIGAGTAITTGGYVTKEFGEDKAVRWTGKAISSRQQALLNKQAAEAKKDAARIRRHQVKVERLERELMKEQEAFRASEMTMEAQLA